jgi:hypothetical protein
MHTGHNCKPATVCWILGEIACSHLWNSNRPTSGPAPWDKMPWASKNSTVWYIVYWLRKICYLTTWRGKLENLYKDQVKWVLTQVLMKILYCLVAYKPWNMSALGRSSTWQGDSLLLMNGRFQDSCTNQQLKWYKVSAKHSRGAITGQ